MFLYKSPLVMQQSNSCWLYGPSIAFSTTHTLEEFEKSKDYFQRMLEEKGYDPEQIECLLKKGLLFEKKEEMLDAMGIEFICDLDAFNAIENKERLYLELKSMLLKHGPVIVQAPAFGYMAVHESAVTGVLLLLNKQTHQKEVFLVINDTMDSRLKAVPWIDYVDIQKSKQQRVIFLNPPFSKKPDLYSISEIEQLIKKNADALCLPSLSKDLLEAGYDTILYSQINSRFWSSNKSSESQLNSDDVPNHQLPMCQLI